MRDLALGGMDNDFRIDQSGWADDLLDDFPAGFFQLKFSRRGGDENHLVPHLLEFLELQRPIVQGAGQAEPVLDQHLLALPVAVVHRPKLRQRHVRFVDDQQKILGEVIDQRVRLLAGLAAIQMPAVILDPAAIADLQNHFQIVFRPGEQPLGFEQFPLAAQMHDLLIQFLADGLNGGVDAFLGHDVVNGRVNEDLLLAADHLAGEGIYRVDGRVDLSPKNSIR